ncbi:putative nonsense-mediated mRNA decay protein [Myxozyma melibiosi]|uniref:Nonsense-mediated mRNA decay protein n=1 Tax=Myxozyma melibiosi TaxID=54550 RepID=A0ABR1F3H6_9ASCO
MDVNGLHQCFASTLDADINIRRHAELQLGEASAAPGFIGACLDIVQSQPFGTVQISAAVYLKNKVIKNWEFKELKTSAIAEDEKPGFRERLIPAIISAPPQTQQHLIQILNRVITYDYPAKWPTFLDHMMQLLHSQDVKHIHTGLICLSEVSNAFRWRNHEARLQLDPVLEGAFPRAVEIGRSILEENSVIAGDMMRLIMKSYRSAIYLELSPRLQDQNSLLQWGNLFLQVVGKELPAEAVPEDEDDREQNQWWKAKKWAHRDLNLLFSKYGDPNLLTDSMAEYKEFAKTFAANFAPEILKAYLLQIEKWAGKTLWLSKPVINSVVEYFDQCIRTKSTWDILKPHVDSLVAHVIFPLLCLSTEDMELFEDDPVEYIHKRLDIFDENPTPDVTATNFLITLAERRRKSTFNNILSFINGVVVAQEANVNDETLARQKEGALRMMGSLSHIILGKKSPVAGMMESFFVAHIFHDFQSPFGFLRVRACELLNRFSDAEFKDPNNISIIYSNIAACLNDKHLPVQIEAALALQPLARHESIRNALSQNIKAVMAKLMELTKKIDMDPLIGVMEDFVDMFSEQLAPFAVELAEQLRDQFLRILSEIIEKQNVDPDQYEEADLSDFDEKIMAALGIINTLGTLLLSLDNSPELVIQIEHAITPVVSAVLESKEMDMYGEIFELIDSSSYCLKRITPNLWGLFGLIHSSFKDSVDYFDELLPALENYVTYGAEEMKTNPNYVAAMVDIVNTVFLSDDRLGVNDRTDACRLIQTLLLHIKEGMNSYLPFFIGLAMDRLGRIANDSDLKNKTYFVSLLEVVINCIYCNPVLTFSYLEESGQTANFFNLWFSNIASLSRVHDKRLSAMAILSILVLPEASVPESIRPGLPQLLHGLLQILQSLPAALEKREKLTKEFEGEGLNNFYDYSNLNTGDWDDEDDDEATEENGTDEYVNFLSKEALRLQQKQNEFVEEEEYEDEPLEEETLYESPLDRINVYIVFRDVFLSLQQDPAKNEVLAREFSAEERTVVESIMQQAYKDEADLAQAQAAQQQQQPQA